MEQEVGRFQTEIILFVILAACVILMASNFGAGGFVGDAISNFCFGLMGLMAYLFPIVFFLESAFILINKTNRLAYKKLAAAFVMFCVGQRSFSQTDICRVQLCWIIML